MKKLLLLVSFVSLGFFFATCFSTNKKSVAVEVVESYRADIAHLKSETEALLEQINQQASTYALQDQFKKARLAYKQLEWLAEYYYAYTAKHLNGPALEEVEPDARNIVIPPEGFQVIEELLFPQYNVRNQEELLQEVQLLQSNINRLEKLSQDLQTSDAHIFDALRLEVFRIISLGISGFDSPIAQNSIMEAKASLEGIKTVLSFYEAETEGKSKKVFNQLQVILRRSESFLSKGRDFSSFDRLTFIIEYANPLSENLLNAQTLLGIPVLTEKRALRVDAATLFATNAFNADFFIANEEAMSSREKSKLGKVLFHETKLSGNKKRSCASCHQPANAFSDGASTGLSIDGKTKLLRNTPTLINAALQPSLFYDTRVSYLEDQAKEVILNEDEMHGSFEDALFYLKRDSGYRSLFKSAFGNDDISEWQIKNAIASYVRSLTALNSRFDQYMRGSKSTLNHSEKKGFNLFMGKAKCGTCHFAPLFSGLNPPNFTKTDAEVIGVPSDRSNAHLDKDEGKYSLYKIALHKHAFKTPTVRNIDLTAPYMHNGVYQTLEEVIDFYNAGGGVGHGFELVNQTLPSDSLHLSANEINDLVSFMKSLTDTVVTQ